MSQEALRSMLQQVVCTLQGSIGRIQNEYLPSVNFISTSNEHHDIVKTIRESINVDFDRIMTLIGNIQVGSNVTNTMGENPRSIEPTTSGCVTLDNAVENDDNDKTVFEFNPLEENTVDKSNRINENLNNVPDQPQTGINISSQNSFQDTPTSVSDFRGYNINKNTYTPLEENKFKCDQETPSWKLKVESYLNNVQVGTLPSSEEIQDTVDIDDNISSISQQRNSRSRRHFKEDDKENSPVLSSICKEKEVKDNTNTTSDGAQTLTNKNHIPDKTLVSNDHGENTSDIFHVDDVQDDTNMSSLVSESLLKNRTQTEKDNGGIKHSSIQETSTQDVNKQTNNLISDRKSGDTPKKSETNKRDDINTSSSDMNNQISSSDMNNQISSSDMNNQISSSDMNNQISSSDMNNQISSSDMNNQINSSDMNNQISVLESTEQHEPVTNEDVVEINNGNNNAVTEHGHSNVVDCIDLIFDSDDDNHSQNENVSKACDTHQGANNVTTVPDSETNSEHVLSEFKKEESIHIIDDYTLRNSEELVSQHNPSERQSNTEHGIESQEVEYSILSQGGNFQDEDQNPYEVIPSVKVEVVMTEGNDEESVILTEDVASEFNTSAFETNRNRVYKSTCLTPMTPKQKADKRIETGEVLSSQRKKCELGITCANPNITFENKKQNHSVQITSKRSGPESKLNHNNGSGTSDHVGITINKLTNLDNLDKPRTKNSSATTSKKKRTKKRETLVDLYMSEKLSASSSQFNDDSLNMNLVDSLKRANCIVAESLTKDGMLRSDDEDSGFFPPTKQKRRDSDEPKEKLSLPKTPSKNIPSWKNDPLLTTNLNLPSTTKSSDRKSKSKNPDDEDDVGSVCSYLQEKTKDSTVRENLKKLYDARKTIGPTLSQVIDVLSSDDETFQDSELECAINDDDNMTVLSYQNKKHLDIKFKGTAKARKKNVSSLQEKAKQILPSRSSQESSSQDCDAFENKYKDSPPFVLHVNEETGDFVSVCPFYSKILKEHQKRGVKFMWDVCFGSKIQIQSNDEGSGCILAHDMGLGKSLQVIALLHTLKCIQDIPINKTLILTPKSLVQNWENEIIKWTKGLRTRLNVFSWTTEKTVLDLHEWSANGGVYIIGYEMFVSLCKKFCSGDDERSVDFTSFFLNPGPDVIICDEAHVLKNSNSEKHKIISKVRTKRRIALTGTPIQNNLQELYNIVNLVQPTFMRPENFRDHFIDPISRAQNINAKSSEKSKATERISVLHKQLEKVMDREEGSNQEVGLPPKINYDIFLNLRVIQKKLSKFYFDQLKEGYNAKRNFDVERKAQLIGIHPKSLDTPKGTVQLRRTNSNQERSYDWPIALHDDWWNKVLTESEQVEMKKISAGIKIIVAFHILKYAEEKKEKVLIFCDAHEVLNLMEDYLQEKGYTKDVNYFRLDGCVASHKRGKFLNTFNDDNNTDAKVFLLTHRVGGVGLNFTGASRIIMFDMPWNPAHHEQSSNRTHRLGQKKPSFIYRLISKDTMEEMIYKNTVAKQSLARQVVDRKKIKSQHRETGIFSFTYKESPRPKKELALSKDGLLNSLIQDKELDAIHSYLEHGELFELSEEQLNEAQAYEEYLEESRLLDLPGEGSRKRRRRTKKVPSIDIPDPMMSKEHIENYDHNELLRLNSERGNFDPSGPGSQEPMNAFRAMPPPLVPIPKRKNTWKIKSVQETQTQAYTSGPGFRSLPEFIDSTRLDLRPSHSNQNNLPFIVSQEPIIIHEDAPIPISCNENQESRPIAHTNVTGAGDVQGRLFMNPNIYNNYPENINPPPHGQEKRKCDSNVEFQRRQNKKRHEEETRDDSIPVITIHPVNPSQSFGDRPIPSRAAAGLKRRSSTSTKVRRQRLMLRRTDNSVVMITSENVERELDNIDAFTREQLTQIMMMLLRGMIDQWKANQTEKK